MMYCDYQVYIFTHFQSQPDSFLGNQFQIIAQCKLQTLYGVCRVLKDQHIQIFNCHFEDAVMYLSMLNASTSFYSHIQFS